MTLLIVDDDLDFVYLLRRCLRKCRGIGTVHHARNGREALDVLRGLQANGDGWPDICLLDINMPVMNGFEFLQAYDLERGGRSTPVIHLISSSDSDTDRRKASGFAIVRNYLVKPIECEQLIEKIGAA